MILIHGIDDNRSYERYNELLNKFRTSLIISNNKIFTKNKKVSILKIQNIKQLIRGSKWKKTQNNFTFFQTFYNQL